MKLSEIIIVEARKNPEQNPKVSINMIITNALTSTRDTIADVKNLFVSFTAVDKLGVNPSSHLAYDTPIGIYAYPASYVNKIVGSDEAMSKLPFAGSQPYVNLLKAKGNIINVATIDQSQVTSYYNKLDKVLEPAGVESRKKLRELIQLSASEALFPSYPGGQFWYVTLQLAKLFPSVFGKQVPIGWNKLMRAIGIDGVVDTGVGIIHTNEPTQAVFFTIKAVTDVQRHANSYSKQQQQTSVRHGDETKRDQQAIINEIRAESSKEGVVRILKDKGWRYIKYITDAKLREAAVKENPYSVSYLAKPSDREQEIALRYDFVSAVTHMRNINPSVFVKVMREEYSTDKIATVAELPNLSEPLQMELVKVSPRSVTKLNKPSKRVVQTAIDSWKPSPMSKLAPGQLPPWLDTVAKQYGLR